MTPRERFLNVLNFKRVDRLPAIEWAPWWDKTVTRWKTEGLPQELNGSEINEWFGLDVIYQIWPMLRRDTTWEALQQPDALKDLDAYYRLRDAHLLPEEPFSDPAVIERWESLAARQSSGEIIVWLTLDGFFWYPRTLFGIERHLYAFYDDPEIMQAMNQDLLDYQMRFLDSVFSVLTPDFMTFAEDMSYRSGPMCRREHFDQFMAPYYSEILPKIKKQGTVSFVDTDGDCTALVPWFQSVGMEGFLPLERQAGVDVQALRQKYPELKMIGGYNKMVMNQGEAAIREEFEKLLPVMRSGGYVVGCDHQTPPGVSLEQYQLYLKLLREYNEIALSGN